MVVSWVLDEMKTADLKDKRLNNRLREVLSQLGGHPAAGIPAACGGYAEMAGAYRLFDNEHATFEAILQPHIDATRQRIAAQAVAQLGGCVNRKRSDPPGPQTIWIGMQRMHDFALCRQLFHHDARAGPSLV